MIYVGTSGFGYHDWTPGFYPAGLAYEEYLSFYSERFTCCELTFSYYRMPGPSELEDLLKRSTRNVVFTVKAHRRLTHQRERDMNLARRFASNLAPLKSAGKLGAILAQFPFSFINNPSHRAYVCRLRAAFDLPLVAEFRHDSWLNGETLDFLRGWGIGWVSVDAPQLDGMPGPQSFATSKVGYVRFHGRNASRWWNKDGASRYDYDYGRKELLGWIPRIREIERHTSATFVIFNNHWRGQAPANALSLAKMVNKSRTLQPAASSAEVYAG